MLVLSRRADESIVIQPADGVDESMTLAQLFANGPILITLLGGTGRRVKMGIEAPEQLAIRRKDVAEDRAERATLPGGSRGPNGRLCAADREA
jgi:sRNA-binding carbon storage regulator CsrA